MRIVRVILIVLELFLAVLLVSPICVYKRSAIRAFGEWVRHPSTETEAVWLTEQKALDRERTLTRLAVGTLLVANTIGIVLVTKRITTHPK